ncbi:MAG: hypothetical protein COT74_02420 [Bdellovibrionales bacterium CG10_big_fil_rev_8_21_14_0_10_45_34]|nr:MAG: hypothetical protein COT74_02420 [Bdellovibrionales bacterium CG10_big_fil_rev_8_21_14_0_10_45_34]
MRKGMYRVFVLLTMATLAVSCGPKGKKGEIKAVIKKNGELDKSRPTVDAESDAINFQRDVVKKLTGAKEDSPVLAAKISNVEGKVEVAKQANTDSSASDVDKVDVADVLIKLSYTIEGQAEPAVLEARAVLPLLNSTTDETEAGMTEIPVKASVATTKVPKIVKFEGRAFRETGSIHFEASFIGVLAVEIDGKEEKLRVEVRRLAYNVKTDIKTKETDTNKANLDLANQLAAKIQNALVDYTKVASTIESVDLKLFNTKDNKSEEAMELRGLRRQKDASSIKLSRVKKATNSESLAAAVSRIKGLNDIATVIGDITNDKGEVSINIGEGATLIDMVFNLERLKRLTTNEEEIRQKEINKLDPSANSKKRVLDFSLGQKIPQVPNSQEQAGGQQVEPNGTEEVDPSAEAETSENTNATQQPGAGTEGGDTPAATGGSSGQSSASSSTVTPAPVQTAGGGATTSVAPTVATGTVTPTSGEGVSADGSDTVPAVEDAASSAGGADSTTVEIQNMTSKSLTHSRFKDVTAIDTTLMTFTSFSRRNFDKTIGRYSYFDGTPVTSEPKDHYKWNQIKALVSDLAKKAGASQINVRKLYGTPLKFPLGSYSIDFQAEMKVANVSYTVDCVTPIFRKSKPGVMSVANVAAKNLEIKFSDASCVWYKDRAGDQQPLVQMSSLNRQVQR